MNAKEYFLEEEHAVYRYLLRIALPWPSAEEHEYHLENAGKLGPESTRVLIAGIAHRKKRREKAAKRVIQLCAGRSLESVQRAVFAFMRTEGNQSFRSRKRAATMREIFDRAREIEKEKGGENGPMGSG